MTNRKADFNHPGGDTTTTRSARKPAPPDAQQILQKISSEVLPEDSFVLIRPAGDSFYVHAETTITAPSPEEEKKLGRQLARDYIFAIYGTQLPISHVSILIENGEKKVGLTVGVAEREAGLQPVNTWTDKSITADSFLEWVAANRNEFVNEIENRTWVHGLWTVNVPAGQKLPGNHPSLDGATGGGVHQ